MDKVRPAHKAQPVHERRAQQAQEHREQSDRNALMVCKDQPAQELRDRQELHREQLAHKAQRAQAHKARQVQAHKARVDRRVQPDRKEQPALVLKVQ